MKGLIPLFIGLFGTFTFSWVGLMVIPNLQIGALNPQMDQADARQPPPPTAQPAAATAKASPVASAPQPPPATAQAAAANAKASPAASASPNPSGESALYSEAWHHRHLYSPRSMSPDTRDSTMPAYQFLYETRRIGGERSADALQLTGADAPPDGWEVVPSYDAKCLVAYL